MDQIGNELKKILMAGIGAVSTGVEKSQQVIDQLAKKGEITYEQAKALSQETAKKVKQAYDESGIPDFLSGKVKKEDVLTNLETLSVDDLLWIKERIEEMIAMCNQQASCQDSENTCNDADSESCHADTENDENEKIQAVLFDLDGVLVTTDECHYQAWKTIADEKNIPFDRTINEQLRGLSRLDCVDVILKNTERPYSEEEKSEIAQQKNALYISLISALDETSILPGALDTIAALKRAGILVTVASASRNAMTILRQLHMDTLFDGIADGNQVLHGKPDPEVYLKAAEYIHVPPRNCLVVEDADAGLEAAKRGGMRSLGVGTAQHNSKATINAPSLDAIDLAQMIVRDEIK